MTDLYYVDPGYVDAGYSPYIADAQANLNTTVEFSCTTSTPEKEFECDVNVSVTLDISFTRIKKSDANLLLVDSFTASGSTRIRDANIQTSAIFTELAAVGVIGGFFINCESYAELTANVQIIASGSSSTDFRSDFIVIQNRLKDGYAPLEVTGEITADLWYIRNYAISAISTSELSSTTLRLKALTANLNAFATELSITDRTREERANLQVSTQLTAHNSRLKDFHVNLEAFASELTHNERVSQDSAALSVSTQLTAHNTRLKDYSVDLTALAFELTDNTRLKKLQSNMNSEFSVTCTVTPVYGFKSDLVTDATTTVVNNRIKTNTIAASVTTNLLANAKNVRYFNAYMEALVIELVDFQNRVAGKSYSMSNTGAAGTWTAAAQQEKYYRSNQTVTTSVIPVAVTIKPLTSNLTVTTTGTTTPYNLRGFDSQLAAVTGLTASIVKTAKAQSNQIVECSNTTLNTRVRTAQIHTDVVATEMSAVGRIAAFFINCELYASLTCDSQIIARAKSDLLVTATQTTTGVRTGGYKSNCTVTVTSINRNIRVSSGISGLNSVFGVNTNVSKVSKFNSPMTTAVTALSTPTRISDNHSNMITQIEQNTDWIRQSFTRSSMSTIVTCDSSVSKSSANSSHLNVTAESVVWANRLKETLVDLHFNAAASASFRKFSSVHIQPFDVSTAMSAYGKLFYLDIRYGWMITDENRNFSIYSDLNKISVEREDRTFTIGV